MLLVEVVVKSYQVSKYKPSMSGPCRNLNFQTVYSSPQQIWDWSSITLAYIPNVVIGGEAVSEGHVNRIGIDWLVDEEREHSTRKVEIDQTNHTVDD